ncbi:MAG: L-rhamnose isomerase [Clostridia bacterium]|nr:L-rhamnose isomerase [Clostridia bacterium]
MAISDKLIQTGYDYAKEIYAQYGVDIDKAMEKAAQVPVSMHCWQADDVIGCENAEGGAKDGIATTGNYPGRARNADEIRADADLAMSMIPGARKFNLHASYAELHGKKIDRDAYTIAEFQSWVDWAKEKNMGLDFNPTYFGHAMVKDGFTLSSPDKAVRDFWIEHGKRCREIGEEFAKQLNKVCVINYWMPDGMKDTPADTAAPRQRMIESLDRIFEKKIDEKLVLEGVESKLFALGLESYTVGSHELMLGYALTRGKMVTLDAGHFHPTEVISAKISACMQFLDHILLHVSRGVRWDSDHVITLDDELQNIMGEIIRNGYEKRVCVALDFFDASINRVAAWVIGERNAQKAVLKAYLEPTALLREAENNLDYSKRLALMEEIKTLPFSAVWDAYCAKQNVPVGDSWIGIVKQYEKDVMSKRV